MQNNVIQINFNDIIHGKTEKHLVSLDNKPNIKMTAGTLEAFLEMQSAAKQDGLDLYIASAYRSFDRQNNIYSEKYMGHRTVLDIKEEPINDIWQLGEEEKIRAILYYSAIPGLSRHHYGTDLDVYSPTLLSMDEQLDLTNISYSRGSQRPLSQWLTKNMAKFKFFRPYEVPNDGCANELWHISYAPEADCFTKNIDLDECLDFISNSKLLGERILAKIIAVEFENRLKIMSPFYPE
jgi:LAS superfamily LD-carboxypeptidase LdcB